ncbi:MAG: hypothetical protein D6706_01505, partial [Chloroflexi bacterium]
MLPANHRDVVLTTYWLLDAFIILLGGDMKRPAIQHGGKIIHKAGDTRSVKAYQEGDFGWVEGYLISWGNPNDVDLHGEYFTPRTELCLDWFSERPVLYHHGLDGSVGLRQIGKIKTVKADDVGVWVRAQIDLRDRYARAVYDMIKTHEFGWSSGSVDHLVKIAPNGEIVTWPLIEGSITPSPAQPAKTTVRPLDNDFEEQSPQLVEMSGQPVVSVKALQSAVDPKFTNELLTRISLAGNDTIKKLAIKCGQRLGISLSDKEIDGIVNSVASKANIDEFYVGEGLEGEVLSRLPNLTENTNRAAISREIERALVNASISRAYKSGYIAAKSKHRLETKDSEVKMGELEREEALLAAARRARRRALRRRARRNELLEEDPLVSTPSAAA